MCVSFTLYLKEKETPKITRKLTIERRQRRSQGTTTWQTRGEETKEESRNNGLVNKRIVGIGATCSSKMEKKKLAEKISIRVSFIFFNFHPLFWLWLRLLFHFELVF